MYFFCNARKEKHVLGVLVWLITIFPPLPLPESPVEPPLPPSPPPHACFWYAQVASSVLTTGVESLLYVAPATSGMLVDTYIPTNALVADTDENNPPNPLECCALCTGDANQSLYHDVARTQPSDCPISFVIYATGIGWISQFHASDGTAVPCTGVIHGGRKIVS